MAGVSIRVSSATFTRTVASLTLPDLDGLIAEYILGGDQARSVVNRANPSSPLTVVGAPSYNTYDAFVTNGGYGNNGFDTGIAPTGDVTMLAVSKTATVGTHQPFMSASAGASLLGFEIDSTVRFANSLWGVAPNLASIFTPSTSNFIFMGGVGVLGAAAKLYLGNAGALSNNTGAQTGGNPRNTSATIHMASNNITSGQGSVAYCALFNRAMTEAEVLAAYLSLKAYYTGKIVVN